MKFALVAPALVAVAGVVAACLLPRLLTPRRATQVLTASILFVTLAVMAALVQLALAGVAELPGIADALGWCRALYHGEHGASPLLGVAAGATVVAVATGMGRRWRRIRSDAAVFAGVDGIELVHADGPVAFAVPGRPGGVVVGTALMQQLDWQGRSAVLAHENAHLDHRHHLYTRITEVCSAGLPFLRPLASEVHYLTERWADEVAADHIGSRRVLAETIAEVALMPQSIRAPRLSFGGQETVSRVQALLEPRQTSVVAAVPAVMVVTSIITLGSVVQVHHLADFFSHICPG